MTDQDKNFNYAALINREMEILDYKSMMKQKLEEGSEEATIKHLICLIKKKNFSVEEALTTLEISNDQ